jgi:MFS family permease
VSGASATNSGLLLLPLMLGVVGASIVSGQLISRTGHYKVFPVVGCALAAVAMWLLSMMGTGTAQSTVTAYMILLGIGIGLTMQTLILAVQNVVPVTELGVATSSVSFFRSMGGSIGVALFGAVFNNLLTDRIGSAVDIGEGGGFTPAAVRQLPEAVQTVFVSGFADALTTVFLFATPLLVLGFVLACMLREVPLRSSVEAEPTPAAASLDPDESAMAPSLLH